VEIVDGYAVAPDEPGLGIAWDRDAIDQLRKDSAHSAFKNQQ
jgi:L-alanine-DL-glutamate epimerase-like enolase superfamily enzyme